jgi:hypothetical protein
MASLLNQQNSGRHAMREPAVQKTLLPFPRNSRSEYPGPYQPVKNPDLHAFGACPGNRLSVFAGRAGKVRANGTFARRSDARALRHEPIEAQDVREQVAPSRIVFFNQLDFPIGPPALHQVFAALRRRRDVMRLEIDEATGPIALREAIDHALAMLPTAARHVAGHAGIDDAARFARGHVDEELFFRLAQHGLSLEKTPDR